jgi:hypothetical protein
MLTMAIVAALTVLISKHRERLTRVVERRIHREDAKAARAPGG